MQEKDALIEIYDDSGKNTCHKFRHEINKKLDIVKTAVVLILNDKKQVFICKSKEEPWPGKWGCSAAGIVRHEESLADAAKRTLKRELGLTEELTWLGESFYNFDGIRTFMSVFQGKTKTQPKPKESEEAKWVSIEEAKKMDIMPTLAVALEVLRVK